jgi:hypothetical protein
LLLSTRSWCARSFLITAICCAGCSPSYEARVYDAPKVESEFVKAPPPMPNRTAPMMGGSNIPTENRRILGAAIPYESVAYFLKSTDTIERLSKVTDDFRVVVERFSIDANAKSIKFELPAGWKFNWREGDIAMAEISVSTGDGAPILFTVTELPKPSNDKEWDAYLLSNVNRWRGQLSLPATDFAGLELEKTTIPRQGATLPAYLFDADGRGKTAESSAASNPKTPAAPLAESAKNDLKFEIPDTWQQSAATPPRLATFRFSSNSRTGEVAVTKANNAPIPNARMWCQQILKVDDESVINSMADKAVSEAQDIESGQVKGKLYSIRSSNEADSRAFLIAAIPTNDTECLFVKVSSDPQSLDEQKANLVSFVQSLRWE